MVVSQNKKLQYRPHNAITLMVAHPKKVFPQFWETSSCREVVFDVEVLSSQEFLMHDIDYSRV